MEGADWLWRQANIEHLCDTGTPKKPSKAALYVIEDKEKMTMANQKQMVISERLFYRQLIIGIKTNHR